MLNAKYMILENIFKNSAEFANIFFCLIGGWEKKSNMKQIFGLLPRMEI